MRDSITPSQCGTPSPEGLKPAERRGGTRDEVVSPVEKALVFVSPAPGGNKADAIIRDLSRYFGGLGIVHEFVVSWNGEDLKRSAAAAAEAGYRRVVVVGDDAAARQVVSGAYGQDLEVAIVGYEDTCAIAKWLGIPRESSAAVQVSWEWASRPVDLVCATLKGGREEFYLGLGQVGLGAENPEMADKVFGGSSPWRQYLAMAKYGLGQFGAPTFRAEWDGEQASGQLLQLAAWNTAICRPSVGSTQVAKHESGWLDVALAGLLPWARVFESVSAIMGSDETNWPIEHHFQTRQLKIATDPPMVFYADCDMLGYTPVELRIIPQAVRIVLPPLMESAAQ